MVLGSDKCGTLHSEMTIEHDREPCKVLARNRLRQPAHVMAPVGQLISSEMTFRVNRGISYLH